MKRFIFYFIRMRAKQQSCKPMSPFIHSRYALNLHGYKPHLTALIKLINMCDVSFRKHNFILVHLNETMTSHACQMDVFFSLRLHARDAAVKANDERG